MSDQRAISAAIRLSMESRRRDPDAVTLADYANAIEALLAMCDDEDQRPGGQRLGTENVRDEIAAALGLLDDEGRLRRDPRFYGTESYLP